MHFEIGMSQFSSQRDHAQFYPFYRYQTELQYYNIIEIILQEFTDRCIDNSVR